MSKALYRKYRPQTLSEVIGQDQVVNALQKSLDSNKISHAYLFIGPRGCGKTSVARIFAHAVNHFDYQLEDEYTDIIEIDAASNTGVDNIRELREKAAIAPTKGKYKIYIIDEVHMLSKSAFNALLKTLEEPPAHVIFIMATTDAYKVPVTITSRAQVYTFKLSDKDTMCKHLRHLCEEEGIKITDSALQIISHRGGGSFRDSISLLDQISTLSDQEITDKIVIDALGLPSDEIVNNILTAYQSQDVVKITTLIKDSLSSDIKPETLAEELIAKIITKPSTELLPLLSNLPTVTAPFPEAKLLVALLNESTFTHNSKPEERPPRETVSNPFSWDTYLDKIKSLSDTVYSQVKNATYKLEGTVLHLYPQKKFVETILSSKRNYYILTKPYPNLTVKIHNFDETSTENPTINQISAIMGGVEEVNNNGEGDPF